MDAGKEEIENEIEELKTDICRLEKEIINKMKTLDNVCLFLDEDSLYSNVEEKDMETDTPNIKGSISINADVRTLDFNKVSQEHGPFDVILMDPPWKLAGSKPSRGVRLSYNQLPDAALQSLPIETLQKAGFIFIWVINNKYVTAIDFLKKWKYKVVDEVSWIKKTVNRRLAKCHGYYLQHAKETCIVGWKNDKLPEKNLNIGSDIIFVKRGKQSEKPHKLYRLIEKLFPGGKYLEIFGRKNNLRKGWVTIGNEL